MFFHLGNLRRRIAYGKLYVDVIASFVEILRQIFLVLQATGESSCVGSVIPIVPLDCAVAADSGGLLRAIRRCGGFRLLGAGAKTNDKNEARSRATSFFIMSSSSDYFLVWSWVNIERYRKQQDTALNDLLHVGTNSQTRHAVVQGIAMTVAPMMEPMIVPEALPAPPIVHAAMASNSIAGTGLRACRIQSARHNKACDCGRNAMFV